MKPSIAILYSSKYGHARQYAQWAAEELQCPLFNFDQSSPESWNSYQTLALFSGLYVGKPRGLDKLLKAYTGQDIIVGVVGLTDPQDQKHTLETIEQNLPADRRDSIPLFYLQGGLNFKAMSFLERIAIGAMISGVRKKENPTETDQALMQSKETSFDPATREALRPILDYLAGK